MMKHRIVNSIFLLAVILPGFSGCTQSGSGMATEYVEGTILLNGTPVEVAQVTFTPKDAQNGMSATGYTDKSGKFKLTASQGDAGKGTLAGEYVVTVNKITWITEKRVVSGEEQQVPVTEVNHIPKVYMSEETTPLKATVAAGKNTFAFQLEGTP